MDNELREKNQDSSSSGFGKTCMNNRRGICTAFLFFVLCIVFSAVRVSNKETTLVTIKFGSVLNIIESKFLSLGLDTSFVNGMMKNLSTQDWENVQRLVVNLSPAYVRLGGNDADRAVFNTTDKSFVNILPSDLLRILWFTQQTNLRLIYNFNVLLRNSSDWDSSNAEKILIFLRKHKAKCDFQLGNEPNSFPHKFNVTIPGKQLGKDFKTLRLLLNSYDKSCSLIGPDVTRPILRGTPPLHYLSDFLSTGVSTSLGAVSWHQYYLNGREASLNDFLNPAIFNMLANQINEVTRVVRQYSELPIWLSETGSAFGGGAPNLSSTFASTFLFLDKLGISSKMGISVVVRQSLLQGHYALIDESIQPLPDFWIALAFKRLVGEKVYEVQIHNSDDRLRLYSHDIKATAKEKLKATDKNVSNVLYGMNLGSDTRKLQITNRGVYVCFKFLFTAKDNDLESKSILLNGKELKWPNFIEAINLQDNLATPISVPPLSLWFWVLCNA